MDIIIIVAYLGFYNSVRETYTDLTSYQLQKLYDQLDPVIDSNSCTELINNGRVLKCQWSIEMPFLPRYKDTINNCSLSDKFENYVKKHSQKILEIVPEMKHISGILDDIYHYPFIVTKVEFSGFYMDDQQRDNVLIPHVHCKSGNLTSYEDFI
jgi:hypothetical protein